MKILVTGGAGFVGSHLVDRLVAEGHEVAILDNFSSGFGSNCNSRAIIMKGDVRVREHLELAATKLIGKVNLIYHLAEFIPNIEGHVIKYSVKEPIEDLNVCVGGTINVCEVAIKLNPMPTVILTSTAAVYGENSLSRAEEPISQYGVAKLSAEQYLRMYNRLYGLPYKIVRFFNIYGPRQHKYIVFDILKKLQGNPSTLDLIGTGNEQRDYIYIDDALHQLMVAPEGVTTNIGTGVGTTSLEIANLICRLRHLNPEIRYSGPWKGNINALVCPDKHETQTRLADGILKVMDWFDTSE